MLQPKPHIYKITRPVHGGINRVELRDTGIDADGIIDFSVSTNPFKLPAVAYEAIRNTRIHQYPDTAASGFIQKLADKTECPVENLVAGNGSTELIRAAATAYLDNSDTAITLSPTYSDYELACNLTGAAVKRFNLREPDNFTFNADTFIEFARRYRPEAIFICNPNNPTGGYIGHESMKKILSAFDNSLVVLDEAYIAFTRETWDSLELLSFHNLLIIRSLTKDYGLAGLRLGYAIAGIGIITALRQVLPPWNVNSAAQCAGEAVLSIQGRLDRDTARLQVSKRFLENQFRKMGFSVVPSHTNFFLVRVGNASSFRDKLLRKGCLVRDCSSFSLPEYIRVAARGMGDCRKLISAVKQMRQHS